MTIYDLPTDSGGRVCSFQAATSSTNDDVGRKSVNLTVTNPSAEFDLHFTVPRGANGVGTYNVDYILSSSLGRATQVSPLEWKVRIPGTGANQTVTFHINPNRDASETYAPTIIETGDYTVGANPTHTMTCTTGIVRPQHINPGSPGYVGHDPRTCINFIPYPGMDYHTPNETIFNTIIDGGVGIYATGITFVNCWITGKMVTMQGANKFIGPQIPDGAPGTTLINCSIEGLHPDNGDYTQLGTEPDGRNGVWRGDGGAPAHSWRFIDCYFGRIYQDILKHTRFCEYEHCLFERHNSDGNHGDIYQMSQGPQDYDITNQFTNCYFANHSYFSPGYPGIWLPAGSGGAGHYPWGVNSVVEIDTDGSGDSYSGSLGFTSCWIDGGGHVVFLFEPTFDSFSLKYCQCGNQNHAWPNNGDETTGPEPSEDAVFAKYGVGSGGIYHIKGNKWGGDYINLPYKGTAFKGNNEAAF